ncbi:MAG: hypothetical protein AMJ89_00700, partial [candidate division Zixibacteria bacterium SM23_73]
SATRKIKDEEQGRKSLHIIRNRLPQAKSKFLLNLLLRKNYTTIMLINFGDNSLYINLLQFS